MVLRKQSVELPLSAGIERKTQDYAGNPPFLEESENTVFFDEGSAKKRAGESQVGSELSLPQRALLGRAGQVAVVGYDGLRYYNSVSGDWSRLPSQVGTDYQAIRCTPCKVSSRKIRGDIPLVTSATQLAVAGGNIIYAWSGDNASQELTVRAETPDGEIIIPDTTIEGVSASARSEPRSYIALVANGNGQARLFYRSDTPGIDYVDIDVSAGTVSSPATLVAEDPRGLSARADVTSNDHVYFACFNFTTNNVEIRRIDLSDGSVDATATFTYVTMPALNDARCTLYVASDGKVWVFTADQTDGSGWHCAVFNSDLTSFMANSALSLTTWGSGIVRDVAVAQKSTNALTALLIAQHERDSTENPTNSAKRTLKAYSITISAGSPTITGHGLIPNAAINGRGGSIVHGTAHHPFFPVQLARDVDLGDATYSAGGDEDFEIFATSIIVPHYPSPSAGVVEFSVIARLFSDVECYGHTFEKLSATKLVFAATGKSSVGIGGVLAVDERKALAGSSMYLATVDFDPQNVPSEKLLCTWFGLAHQYAWSGSELLDGVCPASPGPPVITASGGTGSVYRYKLVWEWEADDGALVRSHESPPTADVTNDFSTDTVTLQLPKPPAVAANGVTNKRMYCSVYRTKAGALNTYYLVARQNDLSDSAIASKPGFWEYTDSDLDADLGAVLYTTGNRLNAETPPAFLDIAFVGDRVWAIDAQDDHRVWPSMILEDGTAPEWNYILSLRLPGAAVAVEELGGRPLVIGDRAVWTIYGLGPGNTGSGGAFEPIQITNLWGASSSATVAKTPLGVVFKARRGLVMVAPDMQVQPWGVEVDDVLSGLTVSRVLHVESQHQVRVYTEEGTVLVHDYLAKRWSTWTNMPTQELIDVDGTLYRLEAGDGSQKVWQEDPALPSAAPSTWSDVGSPSPGTVAWRSLERFYGGRIVSVGDDGYVGYRDGDGAWVTQQLEAVIPTLWYDASNANGFADAGTNLDLLDLRDFSPNCDIRLADASVTQPGPETQNSLNTLRWGPIGSNQAANSVGLATYKDHLLPVAGYTGYCGFAVIRVDASPDTSGLSTGTALFGNSSGTGGNTAMGFKLTSGGDFQFNFTHRSSTPTTITVSSTMAVWHLVEWRHDPASGGTMYLSVDGTETSASKGDITYSGSSTHQMNLTANDDVHIGEIRWFDTLLSSAGRASVRSALESKWGL